MFYGTPSEYLWEAGAVHTIPQGEGVEHCDALMPLLVSVGQHSSLEAVQLRDGEHLFPCLNDIYTATLPSGQRCACLGDELRTRANIHIHGGKTKVWNQGGVRPPICGILERVARANDPRARVRRGSDVPTEQQGIKVLGIPLHDIVRQHLSNVHEEQQRLLTRIPLLADVQSAWLLLVHCAQARANFLVRAVRPEAVEEFAVNRDGLIDLEQCEAGMRDVATLPLVGRFGAQKRRTHKPVSFLGQLGGCDPDGGAHATQKLLSQLFCHLEGNPNIPQLGSG